MSNKGFICALTALVILINIAAVSADLITPGYKSVSVTNKVTNMDDFQSYYLFVSCDHTGEPRLVQADGIILGQYRFCGAEVYAIEKDDFNNAGLIISQNGDSITSNSNEILNNKYFESLGAIKLAENLTLIENLPSSSPTNNLLNLYTLEIGKVKGTPDSTSTEKDFSGWIYLSVSLIALIIIIYLLIRRKNVK
jgi:hypothetical protein